MSNQSKMKSLWYLWAVVGSVLGIGFVFLLVRMFTTPAPVNYAGTVLDPPEPAYEFTLTNQNRESVRQSDFAGKLVVLYFGFTFCPDICPATMSQLAQIQKELGELADQVQVIMITIDPDRDTPDLLGLYMRQFDPTFIGLTGTPAQIAEVTAAYGVFYEKQPVAEGAGYLMDHTSAIIVIDRAGNWRLLYTSNTPSQAIASDLRQLLTSND